MSVTKLLAVTIAGTLASFDTVVNDYLTNYDIHLENALTVLNKRHKIRAFHDTDSYDPIIKSAGELIASAGFSSDKASATSPLSLEEMGALLDKIKEETAANAAAHEALLGQIRENESFIRHLSHLENEQFDLSQLGALRFLRYRYGHMPKGSYKTLKTYLTGMDIVFFRLHETESAVWGFFFVAAEDLKRADELLTSLYFERVRLPDDRSGTPREVAEALAAENEALKKQAASLSDSVSDVLSAYRSDLLSLYQTAKQRQLFSHVRAMAACSDEYFYLVGWMSRKDAAKLESELRSADLIVLFNTEKPHNLTSIVKPPTKLKNFPFFRPFELFVKMYGYPNYQEMDPTPLLALTYILFFGMMFGDVGQSLLLCIGGFFIGWKKQSDLAKILGLAGLSGVVFGFLYGSVFGNEELLPGVLEPMHNISTLLIGTIALGGVILVFSMCINIANHASEREFGAMLFSHNGLSGLVFYLMAALSAVAVFTGAYSIPTPLMIAGLILPLILMYLCEPLSSLIEGKKDWLPKDGIFYVQSLFELFEVLLSYFSNTLSFLRIGALAIAHVGMMKVVAALATGSPAQVILVNILGNLLVMVLEGMIVCIQVLRLEYYEMFSRYYKGDGKPFVSLRGKNNNAVNS